MKSKFMKELIIDILITAKRPEIVPESSHRYRISHATYYLSKNKYSNMTIHEAKGLSTLEAENSRLKGIVAHKRLDIIYP